MDLVLLAERTQKISILTTSHLKVKQYGHSLRRRANARNYNSSRWPIYIINSVVEWVFDHKEMLYGGTNT